MFDDPPEQLVSELFRLGDPQHAGLLSQQNLLCLIKRLGVLTWHETFCPEADRALRSLQIPDEVRISTLGQLAEVTLNSFCPMIAERVFGFVHSCRGQTCHGIRERELAAVVKAGLNPTPEAVIGIIFSMLDENGDGVLETQEVADFIVSLASLIVDALLNALDIAATNTSGPLAERMAEEAFAALDQDQDGALSREEANPAAGHTLSAIESFVRFCHSDDPVSQHVLNQFAGMRDTFKAQSGELELDEFCDIFQGLCTERVGHLKEFIMDLMASSAPDSLEESNKLREILDPPIENALRILETESCQNQMRCLGEAVFALADTNQDGKLCASDLVAVLDWVTEPPGTLSEAADFAYKLDRLFAVVDIDADGEISKSKLSCWIRRIITFKEELLRLVLECMASLVCSVAALCMKQLELGYKLWRRRHDGQEISKLTEKELNTMLLECELDVFSLVRVGGEVMEGIPEDQISLRPMHWPCAIM
jgi:Ca2+-binding EF-hand superfamily protein